eukprot:jgi/Botrbrau1/12064/Bobra.0295s0019.1
MLAGELAGQCDLPDRNDISINVCRAPSRNSSSISIDDTSAPHNHSPKPTPPLPPFLLPSSQCRTYWGLLTPI